MAATGCGATDECGEDVGSVVTGDPTAQVARDRAVLRVVDRLEPGGALRHVGRIRYRRPAVVLITHYMAAGDRNLQETGRAPGP